MGGPVFNIVFNFQQSFSTAFKTLKFSVLKSNKNSTPFSRPKNLEKTAAECACIKHIQQIHSPYYYVYSHISLLGLFFKNPNKGELPYENDL